MRICFRFCYIHSQIKNKPMNFPIFDNIIQILRPFDININIEEMLESVKIIGKYSQHTFYKFPLIQSDPLQSKQFCKLVSANIKSTIPNYPKYLSLFFNLYRYPQQMALPKFIHTLSSLPTLPADKLQKLIKLSACLEEIQLALSMHHLVDEYKTHKHSFISIQSLIYKKMSDKKLVLGGDYFHSQASVLSANILGKVEVPLYLSILEEEAAKAVFYKENLFSIITNQGPQAIQIENIYQLAYHSFASQYAFTSLLTNMIINNGQNADDAFKGGLYLGLSLQFQEQIKEFLKQLPILTNQHLMNVVSHKESNFYNDRITLPLYYYQNKAMETTVLQQIHDHTIKETERVIQTMQQKSKEHYQKIGVDFALISKFIDYFRLYE